MSHTIKTIMPSWIKLNKPNFQTQLITKSDKSVVKDVLSWLEQNSPENVNHRWWLEYKTVIIEAFDNVVRHAHKSLPEETIIKCQLEIYVQGVVVKIWDQGPEFDLIHKLKNAPETVPIEVDNGRGLIIMRRVLDYINYDRQQDQRNCLIMVKEF